MNTHSSVGYCLKCDLYVAADQIDRCDECGERYCPECRTETCDPSMFTCSGICAARFNFRTKYNQARKEALCQRSSSMYPA